MREKRDMSREDVRLTSPVSLVPPVSLVYFFLNCLRAEQKQLTLHVRMD